MPKKGNTKFPKYGTFKPRSSDQTAISVSLNVGVLEDIDKRVAALRINRSQYFTILALNDIATGESLTIHPTKPGKQLTERT